MSLLKSLVPDLQEIGLSLLVDLGMAFAAQRFAGMGSGLGGGTSAYAGNAWTSGQYLAALVVAVGGGYGLAKGFGKKEAGRIWARDGVKSLAKRLVFTEGFARFPWLRTTFGAALAVHDDAYGNRWMTLPNGDQISMAGLESADAYGALEPSNVYDGLEESNVYGDDLEDMEDDGSGVVPVTAIDADAADVPGFGRRYQAPSARDLYRQAYARLSVYAPVY